MSEHTPTPWKIVENASANTLDLHGPLGQMTVLAVLDHEPEVGINGDPDGAHADMRHIIRCVNSYDTLVASIDPETLEAIANEIDCHEHSARAGSLRVLAKYQRAALIASRTPATER